MIRSSSSVLNFMSTKKHGARAALTGPSRQGGPYGERCPSGFLTTVSLAIWFWEVPRTAPQLTVYASSFSWNSARHLIMATSSFLLKLMHSLVCN